VLPRFHHPEIRPSVFFPPFSSTLSVVRREFRGGSIQDFTLAPPFPHLWDPSTDETPDKSSADAEIRKLSDKEDRKKTPKSCVDA
jgi:hypothetical protein